MWEGKNVPSVSSTSVMIYTTGKLSMGLNKWLASHIISFIFKFKTWKSPIIKGGLKMVFAQFCDKRPEWAQRMRWGSEDTALWIGHSEDAKMKRTGWLFLEENPPRCVHREILSLECCTLPCHAGGTEVRDGVKPAMGWLWELQSEKFHHRTLRELSRGKGLTRNRPEKIDGNGN